MITQPVTAVIVAYNSQDILARCLHNLERQAAIAQIIVVDNCSTDDTCELVREKFPDVILIENLHNLGFGWGSNTGLEKVATPFALLINPDAMLEEGALEALLDASNRYKDAAILAPLLADGNGHAHKSYKQNVFDREKSKGKYHEPEGDLCADFLSGAVWLMNVEHMRKVGFFDTQLFLYYEDDDMCLRVRKEGLGLVLVSSARALHDMGTSSGELSIQQIAMRQEQLAWSRLYIEKKYLGVEAARKLAARQRIEYGFKASLYTLQFNWKKVARYRARIKGIFDFTEGLTAHKAA